jgi:hypothetical protein
LKKLAETSRAGGTECPTIENDALALVAQAVPPATCVADAVPELSVWFGPFDS